MKKLKFIIIGAALMALAIPSVASADVPRCEASVPVSTTITTATFTAIQPANEYNQWNQLWTRDFTVIVNADNTFSGTTGSLGDDANGTFDQQVPHAAVVPDETVTGKFNTDGTVTLHGDSRRWRCRVGLANAPMDNTSDHGRHAEREHAGSPSSSRCRLRSSPATRRPPLASSP